MSEHSFMLTVWHSGVLVMAVDTPPLFLTFLHNRHCQMCFRSFSTCCLVLTPQDSTSQPLTNSI